VAVEFVEVAPPDERLAAVFEVMRELRDQRTDDELRELYAAGYQEGYRVVGLFDEGQCRAAAGYRVVTNFVNGRNLYIDDLITAARWRSNGYGRRLNDYLAETAAREGCGSLQLDSATHRRDAHRFYFRERYAITSFHFGREVRAR
jgi:GNAT superfamily N-acetyltransferase